MKTFPGYVNEFGIDYKTEKKICSLLRKKIGGFFQLPKRIPLLLIVLKYKKWGQEIFDVIQNEQINNCLKKDMDYLVESKMISLRKFDKYSNKKYYNLNWDIIKDEINKIEEEEKRDKEECEKKDFMMFIGPARLINTSYYNLDDD